MIHITDCPRDTDPVVVRTTIERILSRWPPHAMQPHFPDIMAALAGWNPLTPGESMTVHHGGNAYTITRNK